MSENKSKKFIYNFFSKLFVVSLSVFLLGYYIHTYAIASPYQPGQTLDPACTPTDTNCYVQILPDQTGNSGKFLMTDGSVTSWVSVAGGGFLGSTSNVATETWLGTSAAGLGTASTNHTVFLGIDAGKNATGATYSNFIGSSAGSGATSATSSNFFGTNAGGLAAGANNSNIFGQNAGYLAVNAFYSNFFGTAAGNSSTNANDSNFFGHNAGRSAPNASNSIFIGQDSGFNDTVNNTGSVDDFSILIGKSTLTGGFKNSIAIGGSATNTAQNQFMIGSSTRPINQVVINGSNPYINFTGTAGSSGYGFRDNGGTMEYKDSGGGWGPISAIGGLIGSTSTIGNETWVGTNTITMGTACDINSTFIGTNAGKNQAAGCGGTMIGLDAGSGGGGQNATFVGREAGMNADDMLGTVIIGYQAGKLSGGSSGALFLGMNAGGLTDSASYSTFIGINAGQNSSNSAHSIYIGRNAGQNQVVDNRGSIDDFNILIGNATSAGGFKNSIAMGGSATNTAENQFMIGSTTRPIEEVFITGASQTCTIRPDTAGINCTSDERLKTNISDLSPTLDLLKNIRTITYNWKSNPNLNPQIGFLAQNLKESFPTLVSATSTGYYQVNYAGMTPILVNAIKELNVKIEGLSSLDTENANSLGFLIKNFLGSMGNQVSDLYASIIHSDRVETKTLCVGSTCVTEDQFLKMVQQIGNSGGGPIDPPPLPTDICPNIDDVQSELPTGYHLDETNNCIADVTPPPDPTPTPPDQNTGDGAPLDTPVSVN